MYSIFELLGRDLYMYGRSYSPRYINYLNHEFKRPYYYHYFDVRDDYYTKKHYKVCIKNNGSDIYEHTCDCEIYKYAGKCKHIAAVLLNYYYQIEQYEYIDELLIGNRILNSFKSNDIKRKKGIKRKVNIEVELVFDNYVPSFRILIGIDKLYVITESKLSGFIRAIKNNGIMEFGKNFVFDGSLHYFDDFGKKIIDFLLGFNDNYGNAYLLSKREFNNLLEIIGDRTIKIKGHGSINEIKYGMPTPYHLSKQDNYILSISDFDNYAILTNDCTFILYDRNLYILDAKEANIIMIYLRNRINEISFSDENIDLFKNGLLNEIKKNIIVDDNIDTIKLPSKPDVNLYFDISNILKCKLEFDYHGTIVNYFDKEEAFRSQEDELEPVSDLISNNFYEKDKSFVLEDSDSIYDFIENNLSTLNDKYHVFLDKKLQETKFIKKLNIKNNFSIGQDNILSYNFDIDGIDKKEVSNLIKALKVKKKYYRLKNNEIVNLLDDDLQDFSNIIEGLDIKKEDIESGEIIVPKYKAIYIDSLKNKYKNIETNNLFNKFIDNFKEFQNVKLKLDNLDKKILRDYQVLGVKWLYTIYKCDLGGILADEMGLGKTLQTITLIKHILKENKDYKILIVSPTALVYNWKKEFDKFAPDLKYITVSENKKARLKVFSEKDNYNIFITSYGLISHDNDEYEKMNFELCVIDEGQKIKNYKANMTMEVKKIKAKCKIALTGTPIENNLTEIWSIFDFIMPGYLNNVTSFHSKYNISDTEEESKKILSCLKDQIKPFILRRKKSDVLNSLPDKIEKNLYVELPSSQKILYANEVKETKEKIDELVSTDGFMKSKMEILSLLTRLREICIDPSVLYENYHGDSIKLDTLLDIIKENMENNHKMLIFSSFKRILDNVGKLLKKNNINYYMIDGSVKSLERIKMVDSFNSDETPVFLITLKAGGVGLNLTGADTVIHLDMWWNPQVENQATDRAHRIGQTKNVSVLKIICKGTIEEHIIELQEKKKFLVDNLIENNDNVNVINNLSENDIKNLLSFSNEEV